MPLVMTGKVHLRTSQKTCRIDFIISFRVEKRMDMIAYALSLLYYSPDAIK